MLAADRQMNSGDARIGTMTKVRRTPDGRLLAASGDMAGMHLLLDWLCEPDGVERPATQANQDTSAYALEVCPDGTVLRHEEAGSFPIQAPFTAMGSGAPYALAAMACGKTAAEAVEVAAQFDVWTGGGVDVLVLGELSEAL